MISGEMDTPTYNHPDGVLSYPSKAKLICSNENAYRGRFTSESQASSVGSIASAKVHSALRWLRANHGVVIGGRTFLWWSPQGKKLPSFDFLEPTDTESEEVFPNYQRQLRQTLDGYCQKLKPEDGAVIAAFDAATRGRLSVTYYSEMRALDLVDRLQNWYDTCRLDTRYRQAWSPTLKSIVKFAFGTQRVGKVVVDSKAYGEHFQHLFHCLVDAQPLPSDIVRALVLKANHLEIYSTYNKKTKSDNREQLLSTACAVVRKYHNDKLKKEVWTLALDEQNLDRSYLFGRLLAVAEHVERSTYEKGEGREPNAIRLQTVFSQRPIYAWRILEEALKPYYQHLEPKDRKRFRKVTEKIAQPLNPDDPDLNKKLDDVYLLGYYHQRAALTCKKDAQNNNTSEEYEHESAEE